MMSNSFDKTACDHRQFVRLHAKSGSLSPIKHFAYDLRQIVRRQTLPGYELVITQDPNGTERLNFAPTVFDPFHGQVIRPLTPKGRHSTTGRIM